MTEQLRKSKRKEIISKKRENLALNQILQEGEGYSEQEWAQEKDEHAHAHPLASATSAGGPHRFRCRW